MKTLPDDKIREINKAVVRWLKYQDISYEEAARRLGTCIGAVYNQTSTRHFTPKMARRWHEAFGLSERYLLTGEGTLVDRQNGYRKVVDENEALRGIIVTQKRTLESRNRELERYRQLYGPLPSETTKTAVAL